MHEFLPVLRQGWMTDLYLRVHHTIVEISSAFDHVQNKNLNKFCCKWTKMVLKLITLFCFKLCYQE